MIRTLNPDTPEFLESLWIAWSWTQKRKAFYFRTGGFQDFPDYLRIASAENRKQFAVDDSPGKIASLITVEMFARDSYEFHVTSKRGVSPSMIRVALVLLADSFFKEINAQILATTVPRYAGHWHTGSRALAEYLGCVPRGAPEKAQWVDGFPIEYQLYVLSREDWLKWAEG